MDFIIQETTQAHEEDLASLIEDSEEDLTVKLPHSAFMDVIATNPKHKNTQLDYLDPRCEEVIKDCKVQFYRDHVRRRNQSAVSEDKTHKLFQGAYTLESLKKVIKHIVIQKDSDDGMFRYFKNQVRENPKRKEYFIQKGLEKSEAFACALALSFYTGYAGYGTHTSDRTNRGASQCIRTANMDANSIHAQKYFPIMHYMIKALAYIPYHWGSCIRFVELTSEEQGRYQVGSIISLIQFTSSTTTKGSSVSYFSGRNTVLHIFSLSGRCIQPFSNFPHEEEVLFAPWCTFLVTKSERKDRKLHIYLRQVELGITQNTILWVDDRIMDEKWENKALMEYLTSQGLQKNLRIIPKISTNLALAFVDSLFGEFIKKYMAEDFQIVTDMTRPAEMNGAEAGAILIKELRERGFNHRFIVYTFDEIKAFKALNKHAGHLLEGAENYAVISKQKEFLASFGFVAAKSLTIQQFSQPAQQISQSPTQQVPAKSCSIF